MSFSQAANNDNGKQKITNLFFEQFFSIKICLKGVRSGYASFQYLINKKLAFRLVSDIQRNIFRNDFVLELPIDLKFPPLRVSQSRLPNTFYR